MVRLLAVVALLAGCKTMGGLGHVAGEVGHVAGEVGHVAGEVSHVAAEVSHVAAPIVHTATYVGEHILPAAAQVTEAVLASSGELSWVTPPPEVQLNVATAPLNPSSGPLIGSQDPCERCPEDVACGQCVSTNNAACELTPPGAYARCQSP